MQTGHTNFASDAMNSIFNLFYIQNAGKTEKIVNHVIDNIVSEADAAPLNNEPQYIVPSVMQMHRALFPRMTVTMNSLHQLTDIYVTKTPPPDSTIKSFQKRH